MKLNEKLFYELVIKQVYIIAIHSFVVDSKPDSSPDKGRPERLLHLDGLHALLSACYENNLAKFNKSREAGIDYCPMNFQIFSEFSRRFLDENALQTMLSTFDLLPKFQEVPK